MQAEQALREGNLEEALGQLQGQVRADPSNAKHRIFLFQLLAVMGQWQRAMSQLKVAADLDHGALAMAQVYREALRCEVLRGEVFAGKRSPLVFGDPEPWVALLVEALRLTADGKYEEAGALRDQAFEAAPATAGTLDGQPFAWIADADARLGPVLEAVVNGRYYWVPFHRLLGVKVEPPEDLRDLVWLPAQLTLATGGETVALLPARYPGSEAADDPGLRLARKTEWLEPREGVYLGQGQRMLATDQGEFPLLDVREIALGDQGSGQGDG